ALGDVVGEFLLAGDATKTELGVDEHALPDGKEGFLQFGQRKLVDRQTKYTHDGLRAGDRPVRGGPYSRDRLRTPRRLRGRAHPEAIRQKNLLPPRGGQGAGS